MSDNTDTPLFGVSSKLGTATARALQTRETATNSFANALDASFTFGWEAGVLDNNERINQIIVSEMSEWAEGTTGNFILKRLAELIMLTTEN